MMMTCYDSGQFKICWYGTINQKSHEPVLPGSPESSEQSNISPKCFLRILNILQSFGSSGTADMVLINLHSAVEDLKNLFLLAHVLLASPKLAKASYVWQ